MEYKENNLFFYNIVSRQWIIKIISIHDRSIKFKYVYDSDGTATTAVCSGDISDFNLGTPFTNSKLERIIYGIPDETLS
jgi:hypothetical protein